MKILITAIACFLIAANSYALFGMEESYQHDADIFRLRHLKYYGTLIQEYHERMGKYPLQGQSEYQNYVHIAAPHQKKYASRRPPFTHTFTDVETFRDELEEGLGRKINLKFDPQKVPVTAPNFYIYMIDDGTFYFAIHLYNERSFANALGEHYHKVEITNQSMPRRGQWQLDALLKDPDFLSAIDEEPHKEEFFKQLELKYN
jgi:hypothetical protein